MDGASDERICASVAVACGRCAQFDSLKLMKTD
jgi:hypothetical protein